MAHIYNRNPAVSGQLGNSPKAASVENERNPSHASANDTATGRTLNRQNRVRRYRPARSTLRFDHHTPLSHSPTALPRLEGPLKFYQMDLFTAELLESLNDLDDRNLPIKSPSPYLDNDADRHTGMEAAQTTLSGDGEETKATNSSLKVRLDRLSGLRIDINNINFTSAEPHGLGGKSEVVKATLKRGDESGEQQVAVKKLRPYDDINERKFSNEFVHEVDMMAQLSHMNIIRLIGFVEDLENGKAWVIMSWEPNGNVSEFLETGDWEIPERISLIKDTIAGIKYLHTHRPPICHGDLKSLNILVSAECRAIITDFGSARIVGAMEDRQGGRAKSTGVRGASAAVPTTDEPTNDHQITIVATNNQLTLTGPAWSLRWAAPEVAMGEQQTLASDIWATGWICWEVMTNKVPFPELNSEGAIILKVVQGQVPAAHEDTQFSQIIRLCNLMMDCWTFDPQSRPNINRCHSEVKPMPSIPPSGGRTSASNAPSAELLFQMGRIHRSQGNYQKAIPLFQQALATATAVGDQKLLKEALLRLGMAYTMTAKYVEAAQYLTQLQDICDQTEDNWTQANGVEWLAKVYRNQSKLDQAEESFIQARRIYSLLGSQKGQANTLLGLGCISRDRSHYSEAEDFFNQARELYARLGDSHGHANALRRLGDLCRGRFEHTKAEELYKQALDIFARIGDNVGRRNVLNGFGRLYQMQGLAAKAGPFYAEAKSLDTQIGRSKR